MYNKASEKFNTLITAPGRTFRARLLVGDEILEGISSIKLSGGSNNGDALTLGSTISQTITIEMDNPEFSLSGKEFALQIGLKLEEDIEYIPMGVFIPDEITVVSDKLSITGYDRMMKLSPSYVSSLPDQTDTVSVLTEMVELTGVPISTDGIATIPMIKPVGFTYREVLMYIAQLHGGFANVNREGVVEIHFWEESDYVLDADMGIKGFAVSGEMYMVENISARGADSQVFSTGNGEKGISFTNPFITQHILDAIWDKVKGFTYNPVECPVITGDPRLDPWDLIEVVNASGNHYKVPLMSIKYEYDGGVSATIVSTVETATVESYDYKGPMERLQENLESKVSDAVKQLQTTISQTTENIILQAENMKKNLMAQIELAMEKSENTGEELARIALEVSRALNSDGISKSSAVEYYETEEPPVLNNYPTVSEFFIWDKCSDILYCSDELICGKNDYKSHVGEIAKNRVSNLYYIFEFADGEYAWRQLTEVEVEKISERNASVKVTEYGITISAKANEETTQLVVTSKGVNATVLFCC